MDAREERGKELAATAKIRQRGDVWIVPSHASGKKYTVNLDHGSPSCTCPDHEYRQVKCKHMFAVEYSLRQETDTKGNTTVTESVKVTYKQEWPAYNAAQTQEKWLFQSLLHDLCRGVPEPVQTFGRPRLPLKDMVFSSAFKVYSTVSCRRFMCDLNDAKDRGYISKTPHYNSIFNYLEMEELTPILKALIAESSKPLAAIESQFAVDASGFSTCRFVTWFNARYGKEQENHDWVKVHLMCGVKTNIVTSVEVTGRYDHDSVQFAPLVETASQTFEINKISADKAYSTVANLELVDDKGGVSYIPFKSSATGWSGGIFEKMFHFYSFQREAFLEHYHQRSNVESTFSMIKRKFGDSIRSKTDTAQINEVLCKVLCHNICVLIQSMFELGVEPTFSTKAQRA
jgi:transposase